MTEPHLGPATAGGMLRAAREKQGLHIAALAAAIKVSPRKLDALENDRHNELPDATFARALAQTVCRTLKVDAKPVLDLLPPAPSSVALQPGRGGLGTPFRERPGRVEPGLSMASVRPLVWAAGALVLAAFAVYFVPGAWWDWLNPSRPAAEAVAPAAVPMPAASSAWQGSAASPPDGTVVTPIDSAASAPASTASQPGVGAAPAAPPMVQAAATPLAQALAPAALAASAGSAGLVQLRTRQAAWVEVRDARGQLLLSRTVLPGESVGLDSSLPVRLVIGNAAATQLAFRGRAVDLAPSTRENVARLELQ